MTFAYTYVLYLADDTLYIGSTDDLRRRMSQHHAGYVTATKHKRPLALVYYEACLSLTAARERDSNRQIVPLPIQQLHFRQDRP